MNYRLGLAIGQIALSFLLIILVLLQNPPEETGFSISLAQPKFNRRGLEKLSFVTTIVILMLFLLSSLLQILV